MIDLMRFTTGRDFTHASSFMGHVGFPELGSMETTTARRFAWTMAAPLLSTWITIGRKVRPHMETTGCGWLERRALRNTRNRAA